MRLGAYPGRARAGQPRSRQSTARREISERHRHRYEVNTGYRERLEQAGLRFAGMSPDGAAARDRRIPRPSLVHRRAVPPRTEIAAVRAAPAVRSLHRRRDRAVPPRLITRAMRVGGSPQGSASHRPESRRHRAAELQGATSKRIDQKFDQARVWLLRRFGLLDGRLLRRAACRRCVADANQICLAPHHLAVDLEPVERHEKRELIRHAVARDVATALNGNFKSRARRRRVTNGARHRRRQAVVLNLSPKF